MAEAKEELNIKQPEPTDQTEEDVASAPPEKKGKSHIILPLSLSYTSSLHVSFSFSF